MAKFSIFIDAKRLDPLLSHIHDLTKATDLELVCVDRGYMTSHVNPSKTICEVVVYSNSIPDKKKFMTSSLGLILKNRFKFSDSNRIYTVYKRLDNYKPTTIYDRRPKGYNYPF